MKAEAKSHRWATKPTLQSHMALGCVAVLALLFAYFKISPILNQQAKVHAYREQGQGADPSKATAGGEVGREKFTLSQLNPLAAFSPHSGAPAASIGRSQGRVRVIERPLFDGLSVTIRARLIRGISSLEPDTSVEATFDSLISEDETRELEDSSVRGAKLVGLAIPNLDLKRMVLQFSQLTTLEGRAYGVQATAIDPETHTLGVQAHYASGLGPRLLGVGISRAMTAGDEVLMSKVSSDPGSSSVALQASQQALRQVNDQAANDLSLEATRGLRETKPELSLPAGTALTLRLRVIPDQGGVRHD